MPKNSTKSNKSKGKNKGLENLVMWKPGQSGNPKGRPKKFECMSDIMNRYLDEEIDTPNGKSQRIMSVVKSVFVQAVKGDTTAQKMIWSYRDGLPGIRLQEANSDMPDEEIRYIEKLSISDKKRMQLIISKVKK